MAKKHNGREEGLARMIQREFAAVHKRFDETPTNQDFNALKDDVRILRSDTETGFLEVAHTLKAIQEELKDLTGMDVEIASLRARLARIERKIGLSR